MATLNILQTILSLLQIKFSDFLVVYPNYQPSKISDFVIAKLKKLPPEIQVEYFRLHLEKIIFAIYHNDLFVLERSQVVEVSEVDWEFCKQLHKNNQGKGWWNPDFRVLRQEADGSLAVQKKGITVYVRPNRHLRLEEQSPVIGDFVSVFTPSSQVIDQFYAVFGDSTTTFSTSVVFIYFNFSPEGAVTIMKELTMRLNAIKVSFIFNVLHNPSNYRRYDSGFLRFNQENYKLIWQVIQTVYAENALHFKTQVPLFTKMLAPGLALAEKPAGYEFQVMDDFGMNRCQIVANALLEAHQNGDDSPGTRMNYIIQHFKQLGLDLERPYLNPNSEDIYTPLD